MGWMVVGEMVLQAELKGLIGATHRGPLPASHFGNFGLGESITVASSGGLPQRPDARGLSAGALRCGLWMDLLAGIP